MASQRLFIATLAGAAATVTARLFVSWRNEGDLGDRMAVDRFCDALRANATALSVVYFSEWIDRWLMGNIVPGPRRVEGNRFAATCFSRTEAIDWANRCGSQFQEQEWLAARLREAASAWSELIGDRTSIVVVREVFDGSALDEDVQAALGVAPSWLHVE